MNWNNAALFHLIISTSPLYRLLNTSRFKRRVCRLKGHVFTTEETTCIQTRIRRGWDGSKRHVEELGTSIHDCIERLVISSSYRNFLCLSGFVLLFGLCDFLLSFSDRVSDLECNRGIILHDFKEISLFQNTEVKISIRLHTSRSLTVLLWVDDKGTMTKLPSNNAISPKKLPLVTDSSMFPSSVTMSAFPFRMKNISFPSSPFLKTNQSSRTTNGLNNEIKLVELANSIPQSSSTNYCGMHRPRLWKAVLS